MRAPLLAGFALAGLAVASLPANATPITTLETVASSYNVFLSGNLGSASQPYTSASLGAMAIGGDAFLRSFSLGSQNTAGVPALTVGGNLTFQSGTIHGDAEVGGNAAFPTNFGGTTVTGTLRTDTLGAAPTSVGHPTVTGIPSPALDFAGIAADLMAASTWPAPRRRPRARSAPMRSSGGISSC